MCYNGENFLWSLYNYAVLLNFDWFQPFLLHILNSVGVIYLVLLNLPRQPRHKAENMIIVGMIPGPSEPSLNILSAILVHLHPVLRHVEWHTHIFVSIPQSGAVKIWSVLLGVCWDLRAGRKVCGFMGHNANKACTKCYSTFSEGFEKSNFSNFNRGSWTYCTVSSHKRNVKKSCNPGLSLRHLNWNLNLDATILCYLSSSILIQCECCFLTRCTLYS